VDKLSSSLWTSYLSYDACFVSKDMCVDCACMSKWKQWGMDRVDLLMRTYSKETMINKPPSHLFTDDALPLHGSWGLSNFNLLGSQTSNGRQMLIGNRLYSTLPIRRISNGLKGISREICVRFQGPDCKVILGFRLNLWKIVKNCIQIRKMQN
jgi:hypothetical protein